MAKAYVRRLGNTHLRWPWQPGRNGSPANMQFRHPQKWRTCKALHCHDDPQPWQTRRPSARQSARQQWVRRWPERPAWSPRRRSSVARRWLHLCKPLAAAAQKYMYMCLYNIHTVYTARKQTGYGSMQACMRANYICTSHKLARYYCLAHWRPNVDLSAHASHGLWQARSHFLCNACK
jgi:hypothetical protein